jgi:hypothetical protein
MESTHQKPGLYQLAHGTLLPIYVEMARVSVHTIPRSHRQSVTNGKIITFSASRHIPNNSMKGIFDSVELSQIRIIDDLEDKVEQVKL